MLVLRIAKAIAASRGDENWQNYLPAARAALFAMREPTLEMLEAAMPDVPDWSDLADQWRDMIDYALREEVDAAIRLPALR